jgi:hypothetical protein
VPSNHSVWGHDDQGLFPAGPEPLRKDPEELIERSIRGLGRLRLSTLVEFRPFTLWRREYPTIFGADRILAKDRDYRRTEASA